MSALARHLAVSLPTVSKSVDMLVRRGWLERWVDKHDRRHTMVRLTPEGAACSPASRNVRRSSSVRASSGSHGGAGTTRRRDAYALAGSGASGEAEF
jgi:DNA-binding MarR family transcriptional regulator